MSSRHAGHADSATRNLRGGHESDDGCDKNEVPGLGLEVMSVAREMIELVTERPTVPTRRSARRSLHEQEAAHVTPQPKGAGTPSSNEPGTYATPTTGRSARSQQPQRGPSEVRRKQVSQSTQIAVWARAAGRCVVCAKSLLDSRFYYHSAILVGQIAHNVAAGGAGPRSGPHLSRDELAEERNLLLLCYECHRNVDDDKNCGIFTEEYVREKKREHELRVRRVTNFATMQRTLVVQNSGELRGGSVHVTNPEITEALVDANLVAHVHDGWRSDIVIHLDEEPTDETGWQHGRDAIDRGLESLTRGVKEVAVDHVSVFALTYIPWLVYLGSRLDDTMSVEVFERHRGAGANRSWCWYEPEGDTLEFDTTVTGEGDKQASGVVVITNLTGTVREARIPDGLKQLPRVVLEPVGATPAAGILRSKADLDAAADAWIRLLGTIEAMWPHATRLHVLGPTPASLAVRMGMHRMKAAHAELVVYHLDGDTYQPTPPITD